MTDTIDDFSNYKDYSSFENSMKDRNDVTIRADDTLALIYYNEMGNGTEKSIVIDKSNMKPVVTQFNRMLNNEQAIEFLEDKNWEKIVVEKCYEGAVITVYNHNNKWYISTRKSLDACDSCWVKNLSYREMFEETISNRINIEDLNPHYCYFFVLLHYKNRNLINYSNLGYDIMYKDLIHIMTTKKYSAEEIDYNINMHLISEDSKLIEKSERVFFSNLSELINDLEQVSRENKAEKCITTEGYILRYYHGDMFKSVFTVLKLQTDIYRELQSIRPGNSNMHTIYLELYQKDLLNEYLPYFSKYNTDIVRRISNSMRSLAQEILDIYHGTRQQNNPEIYRTLKENYKKTLYDLHGIFIKYRKPRYDLNDNEKVIGNRSITVHDVYHYLKNKTPLQLKQIYAERVEMLETNTFDKFIDRECLDTATLTMLMFQNTNNKKKQLPKINIEI